MMRGFLIAAAICGATTILIGLIHFAPALSQGGTQPPVAASPSRPPPPFAGFGPDCTIAPVDPETTFVAAGVYEGDTLANVQIDDAESVATIVRVHVPSGRKQITVLLQASSQVIWDFEGAVDRVARAMIVATRDRGAVRGLAHERTEFLKLTRSRWTRHSLRTA